MGKKTHIFATSELKIFPIRKLHYRVESLSKTQRLHFYYRATRLLQIAISASALQLKSCCARIVTALLVQTRNQCKKKPKPQRGRGRDLPQRSTFSASLLLLYNSNHYHSQLVQFKHHIAFHKHAHREMILPVVKLGTLALKTICKPIANRLKKEAGRHPKFRQFIINIAQTNHRFSTKMQRGIYGHATDAAIRPLNEEKAVQAAADLLGELFVFTVAGAAVIFEVQRSSRSEARKEELRKQELQAMKQRDEDLAKEIELLRHKIEELEQLAKGRGLTGIFNFRHAQAIEDGKPKST